MDNAEFAELCRSAAARLPQASLKISGGTSEIIFREVNFGLFFDEVVSNDRIICFVEIGIAPLPGREEILSRLLSLNLLTGTKTSGVYGLDRETDKLFFIQHLLYPELMDGDELASLLSDYRLHTLEFRQTMAEPEIDAFASRMPDFPANASFLAPARGQL